MSVASMLSTGGAWAVDPCAGHDVACDASGCLVCWPDDSGELDLICEEMSLVEVSLTLPGCVGAPPGLGLVAPQGARGSVLTAPGPRTVLPQGPATQRPPTITPNG